MSERSSHVLTKKHLSRRTVLKGAGVSLGLPLLDAMIPAATALAQTAAAPKLRVGFFYIPHGAIMGNTPLRQGMDALDAERRGRELQAEQDHEAAREVQAATSPRSRNLENKASAELRAHDRAGHVALAACGPTSGRRARAWRPTIDQLIAANIGQDTTLPSLEVASETTVSRPRCPSGGGCYYSTTLSFRNAHVAAADGVQPAQGVPAAVRRGRHGRRARGDLARRRAACST